MPGNVQAGADPFFVPSPASPTLWLVVPQNKRLSVFSPMENTVGGRLERVRDIADLSSLNIAK
jgi:hypothetical protein